MVKKEQDLFFVEIKDPNMVRKTILESLRVIVENLQRFERFKEIRQKKTAKILQLRKSLRDITKQVNLLKSIVPESKLMQMQPAKEKRGQQPPPKAHKKARKRQETTSDRAPASDLERLSSELAAIEEKLKGLQ